jgi:hypothetical protein
VNTDSAADQPPIPQLISTRAECLCQPGEPPDRHRDLPAVLQFYLQRVRTEAHCTREHRRGWRRMFALRFRSGHARLLHHRTISEDDLSRCSPLSRTEVPHKYHGHCRPEPHLRIAVGGRSADLHMYMRRLIALLAVEEESKDTLTQNGRHSRRRLLAARVPASPFLDNLLGIDLPEQLGQERRRLRAAGGVLQLFNALGKRGKAQHRQSISVWRGRG